MKTVNIVVLDYSGVSVNFYNGAEIKEKAGFDLSEKVEEWLRENTEHHLSNCSWMSSEEVITVIEN